MFFFFAIYATVCVFNFVSAESPHPLSNEFIDLINSKQSSWKAGRNFHQDTPLSYIRMLAGVIEDNEHHQLSIRRHHPDVIANLPNNFDPRDKWTNCPSLNEIRDQGFCGSCWAFGAVTTMTDRVCIHSNGTKSFHFSAEDLITCCDYGLFHGCDGGNPVDAFRYWIEKGLVSGGSYKSNEGCRPYTIPPCEHFVKGKRPNCTHYEPTPKCVMTCEASYGKKYTEDLHYGKSVYTLRHEGDIKAELYLHGPIEAGFSVYEDFLHYKSGVYHHTDGKRVGRHAVKMMGWGVEKGEKYWLIANSWNTDWGDKGFFKIGRGENECFIEHFIVTGEPK